MIGVPKHYCLVSKFIQDGKYYSSSHPGHRWLAFMSYMFLILLLSCLHGSFFYGSPTMTRRKSSSVLIFHYLNDIHMITLLCKMQFKLLGFCRDAV